MARRLPDHGFDGSGEPVDMLALLAALKAADRRNSRLSEYARRCRLASYTDALTKAWNRMALYERLGRWERSYKPRIVAFIDIDNFKRLNDSEGHAVGDQALIKLAVVIRSAIRKRDFACRFGGDEFLVVFSDMPVGRARNRLERIRKAFLSAVEGKLSLTIGFTSWIDGERFESVLDRAETTMRQRKIEGKNGVVAKFEGGN